MAIQHTITDEGSHVLIVSTGYQPSRQRINKQTHDLKKMKDGAGVEFLRISTGNVTVLDIYHADVLSPVTGNIAALEVVIGPYFFSSAAPITLTSAQLAAAMLSGSLTEGKTIFVSDMQGTDGGGYVMATSESTVSLEGEGLFLNPDWQGDGSYTGVLAATGFAYGGTNFGQWHVGLEAFKIGYSGLGGGTFAVGDVITGTSGWNGVVVSDNGVDSMTAYSTTTGAISVPIGSDVIGNGSVTANVATVEAKAVQAQVFIWATLGGGYKMYQCRYQALTDGTDPATNTDAYVELAKAVNLGYILVSDKVEYNATNSWLQARFDNAGNFWRMTKAISDLFVWGYTSAPFGDFPWGRANFTGNKLDNCKFTAINLRASFFFNNEAKTGSVMNFVTASAVGYISSVKLGINCQISITVDGATVHDVTLSDFVQYTGKTFTANVSGMWVTENDTTTESLDYANWTIDGWRYKEVILTSAILLNQFSPAPGYQFMPAVADHYYDFKIYWEYTRGTTSYSTAASAISFDMVDPVGAISRQCAIISGLNLSYATNRICPNIRPQMISTAFNSFPVGSGLYVRLASNANPTLGDGSVKLKIWYRLHYFA